MPRQPRTRSVILRAIRRQSAQALVEFAAAVPLLILVFAIAVDFSRVYYFQVAINSAAREGARYGSVYPRDSAGIVNAVVGEPAGTVAIDPSRVTVTLNSERIRVEITYTVGTFTPLVAAVWNGDISTTVEMPLIGAWP